MLTPADYVAERCRFRLMTPCPDDPALCQDGHTQSTNGTEVDMTDFGVCEVFTPREEGSLVWLVDLVPYLDLEKVPGTNLLNLAARQLC